MFRFRPDAPPDGVARVEAGFARLATEIGGIAGFEWGTNNSPEPLGEGYSHIFLVTFEDEAARDAYLPHPKHQAFVQLLLGEGILDRAHVLDFNPQPVPTGASLEAKIAIVLELEIAPDRVRMQSNAQTNGVSTLLTCNQVEEFLKIAADDARCTIAEPGCDRFDFLRDPTAPNKFTFCERPARRPRELIRAAVC